MVGVVLVGHGGMARGLLEAAELILGPQENVVALGLDPSEDPGTLAAAIRSAAERLGTEQLVVLADLFGGSPANAAATLWRHGSRMAIIAGLNLPMLLEVLVSRDASSAADVARVAVQAGREGVRDVVAALRSAMSAREGENESGNADQTPAH